jgi:hypothetical protein
MSNGREIEFRRLTAYEPEGDEREGWVWWDRIEQEDVDAFAAALAAARSEREMQAYLSAHPHLLIQHLSGGHGRWVHPMKRLGSEHVTDFVIGARDTLGFHWTAVELESPTAIVFTRQGDPSARLTHSIRQLQDWRIWLNSNLDYARRRRSEHGLGLPDIDAEAEGLIIIGKDASLPAETRERRRRMASENNTQIRTYDWVVRNAQSRVDALTRLRSATWRHGGATGRK